MLLGVCITHKAVTSVCMRCGTCVGSRMLHQCVLALMT